MTTTIPLQIVISARRGDLQTGYVALDDFVFQTDEVFCTTKPPVCNLVS